MMSGRNLKTLIDLTLVLVGSDVYGSTIFTEDKKDLFVPMEIICQDLGILPSDIEAF